jgi:Tfp pilus assembly protein PilX
MHRTKIDSRGFTLIATLLLMLIMSGVAIGLLMMVNTEGKVGSQDTQNNLAFHAAEGGIEHMTSDLANMFQNIESPTAADIEALSAKAPASTNLMSYPVYTLTPATNPDGSLASSWGQIAAGTYQGLYAQLLPVNLQVTATTSLFGAGTVGDEVNMSRAIEVALIPVFQFGVFCDGDCSFFAGPPMTFAGRVHTNGDLYLSAGDGGATTFQDKLSAWGNVIRQTQANQNPTTNNHNGTVNILTATLGCPGPLPGCRPMALTEGSVVGGPTSLQNGNWISTISVGDYNSEIIDGNYGLPGGTGATKLSLPFINNAPGLGPQPQPFEIIRRPPAGEVITGALGASRLYNEAEIRVLISDSPDELPCGNPSGPPLVGCGSTDASNIRLANFSDPSNGVNNQFGVPASTVAGLPGLITGGTYNTYFATASTGIADPTNWVGSANTISPDFPYGPLPPQAADVTLFDPLAPVTLFQKDGFANAPGLITLSTCSTVTGSCAAATPYPYYGPLPYPLPTLQMSTWNLLDGYLRVEYRDAAGAYHPITAEWLKLGFARGTTPPNLATGVTNLVNPNAILILQKPADRNGDGVVDPKGAAAFCTGKTAPYTCTSGKPPEVTNDIATPGDGLGRYGDSNHPNGASPTQYNWYPINFYDAREGEVRDVNTGDASCAPIGIVNAVEIDVANLQKWLAGAIPGSGNLVDPVFQNGYILYFSDRRGMLKNPNGTNPVGPVNTKTGDSGLEDSINSLTQLGAPDGALDPLPPGKNQSPEDVNNNFALDNWGAKNMGLGLGYIGAPYNVANSVNGKIRSAPGAFDPYLTAGRIAPNCNIAQKNWISGARHVLRLVDGSLGNVPVRADTGKGGFTVAAENPVYILGDYNSSVADPTWANPAAPEPAHAAAAVIADAVTMLSNNWSDLVSLGSPSNDGGRPALSTYYRVAVAAGKNIDFPVNVCCAWSGNDDWGTDGGVHNFLRLLETWSPAAGKQTLNYKGSLVSMFYSTYATGTDKNGNGATYEPPNRNFIFDPLFTKPQNLPPGTPLFRDIDNLSYRQSFTPHTGSF